MPSLVFRTCHVLLVISYVSDIWTLNAITVETLEVAQHKMERIMHGNSLHERKSNTWIRQQIGVKDIIDTIRKSKHRWAGHVSRLGDNRWNTVTV